MFRYFLIAIHIIITQQLKVNMLMENIKPFAGYVQWKPYM